MAAGKDAHFAVRNFIEADFLEDCLGLLFTICAAQPADAQAHGGLDALPDCEVVVCDAELRHVANFVRLEILLLDQIAPLPMNRPAGMLAQPCDHF